MGNLLGLRRNETRGMVFQIKSKARKIFSGPSTIIFLASIKSSALLAALGSFFGGFLFGGLFRSRFGFLFGFHRRGFFCALGGSFFLRRGFFWRGSTCGRALRGRAFADDQFFFGFLFDHLFRVTAEFFFLKMNELVFFPFVFFFVGHPRSPFDSSS